MKKNVLIGFKDITKGSIKLNTFGFSKDTKLNIQKGIDIKFLKDGSLLLKKSVLPAVE